MANPFKYNTGTKTTGCCIRKGNYDIGIVTQREYGPTSSSGFWAGTPIAPGGFASFQNKASQGPSIYAIPDVVGLVAYGKNLNIGTITTYDQVLLACATTSSIALININYPEISKPDNSLFLLDAGYVPSYPWSNTTWYSVAGGSVTGGTLQGSTIWNSGGTDYASSYMSMASGNHTDWVNAVTFGSALTTFTIDVWVNPAGILASNSWDTNVNVVGQQYAVGGTVQTDCNFLIRGNGVDGFEGVVRVGSTDKIATFGAITTDIWNNLTLTYNGSKLISYVNGSSVTTTTAGVTLASNGLDTLIGGTINAQTGLPDNYYFDGFIGVVNVYNAALSVAEIGVNYNAYLPRY